MPDTNVAIREDHLADLTASGETTITVDAPEARGVQLPDMAEHEAVAYANRYLRDLARVRAERRANQAAYATELAWLKEGYEAVNAPLDRREHELMQVLEALARFIPIRGKAKSRKLPGGVLGTRASAQRLEVEDELTLRAAAETDPVLASAFVPQEPRLDRNLLAAIWKRTERVPEGCTVVGGTDTFYVTPAENAPPIPFVESEEQESDGPPDRGWFTDPRD